MVVTQIGYSSYSLTQNYISDLGAVQCSNVCSPWHDIFNATIIIEGILITIGTILVRPGLTRGKAQTAWFGLALAAGLGSVGVGLFPEDANFLAHSLSALLVFVPGNLALIALGFSSFQGFRSFRFRLYSTISGLVGLIAFLFFVSLIYGPLGVGGMERLAAGPLILWVIVTGTSFLQSTTASTSHTAISKLCKPTS